MDQSLLGPAAISLFAVAYGLGCWRGSRFKGVSVQDCRSVIQRIGGDTSIRVGREKVTINYYDNSGSIDASGTTLMEAVENMGLKAEKMQKRLAPMIAAARAT